MRNFRNWLLQLQYGYADQFDVQRASGLQRTCVVMALLTLSALVYFVPNATIEPNGVTLVIVTLALLVLSFAVIGLVQRGQLALGGQLLVAGVTIGILAAELPFGLQNGGIVSVALPLIMAGVLLDGRGLLITTLTLVGAGVLTELSVLTGLITPIPYPELRPIIVGGFALVGCAGVLWVFASSQQLVFERIARAVRDLRAGVSLTQALGNSSSEDELFAQAVEAVRDQFGYYHVQVYLIEPSSHLIVRRARTGSTLIGDDVERRIAPDDMTNPVAEAIRTRAPKRVTRRSPPERQSEFLGSTQTELLLPIRRGDQVLGVLDVHSTQPDAFLDVDAQSLESLAIQVAIALQNLRQTIALGTLQTERDRLGAQSIRLASEVERLNREAAGQTWTRHLQSRASDTIGFDWQNGHITPGTTYSPSLARAVEGTMAQVQQVDGGQVLSVPIMLRGQPFGAMEFRAAGSSPWSPRSIELARQIAGRLALSLENIRLFEQSQTTASREQTINQVAARLQGQTDLDQLLSIAADSMSQALGASRTSIQIKLLDQPSGIKESP